MPLLTSSLPGQVQDMPPRCLHMSTLLHSLLADNSAGVNLDEPVRVLGASTGVCNEMRGVNCRQMVSAAAGSKCVACVAWENGEITIEPLRSIVGMELTSGLRHEPTQ